MKSFGVSEKSSTFALAKKNDTVAIQKQLVILVR